MSKVTWRKEDAEAKKKRLDKEYRDLLNKTFAVMDIRRTDASQARYLGIVGSTYRNKKKKPETVTVAELRIMVEKLDLSAEDIGKIMGCRR